MLETCIEEIMWDVAKHVLLLGGDVVLDYGYWARTERRRLPVQGKDVGR